MKNKGLADIVNGYLRGFLESDNREGFYKDYSTFKVAMQHLNLNGHKRLYMTATAEYNEIETWKKENNYKKYEN